MTFIVSPSFLKLSSLKAGGVSDQAERKKHNHYLNLKENHIFTPIAFESLGACGPETRTFMNALGKLLKKATGEKRALDFLYQKVSIAIQRGNAACVLGTFERKKLDDFYLL